MTAKKKPQNTYIPVTKKKTSNWPYQHTFIICQKLSPTSHKAIKQWAISQPNYKQINKKICFKQPNYTIINSFNKHASLSLNCNHSDLLFYQKTSNATTSTLDSEALTLLMQGVSDVWHLSASYQTMWHRNV